MRTAILPAVLALALFGGCAAKVGEKTRTLELSDPPAEARASPAPVPAKSPPPPPPPPAPTTAAGAPTPAPSEGNWVPVSRKTIRTYYPAVGIFRARRTTKLGSQVNGRVKEVLVDVGDRVKAGQELIRLDPAFFEIEVAQKKADLETARVGLEDAELNLKRMKNLWDKPDGKEPSIPRKLFDDAQSHYQTDQAHLKQAEEAVRNAEERLRESVIRAPYDGVVAHRMVDPGEPVTSAPITSLLEIQEMDVLDLEFSLPQEMLSRVRTGTRVEFEAEGVEGGAARGEISIVYPAVDELTRSFRSRVVVENEGMKFRPGLLVKARVVDREEKDVLVVPSSALSRSASGWQALVLAEGPPARRAVELGVRTEDESEVKAGLSEGERVWVPR